jgi:hypothetical protein
MKLSTVLMAVLITSLSACISYPRTHVLVTPIGVAGIHSFAPPKSSIKADPNLKASNQTDAEKARLAAESTR